MSYSVSQIARLAGVSVRTLHHYDQIGLLSPAERSDAGYRRYGDDDLRRLQQVMFYRELGFALSDISDLVSDPDAEPAEHLRRQHALLVGRLERTRRLVTAVERAMEADRLGISLTAEERLEVFGAHDPAQYADEVTRAVGRHGRLPAGPAADDGLRQAGLARDQGGGRADHRRLRGGAGRGRGAGLGRGDERRGAAPAAHHPLVLRLPAGDAPRPGRDVRGR